jgi:putative nucleotidyltransferase with HDIG domain
VVKLISRNEALNLLKKYVRDEKIIKHCISVEAIMRGIAERIGENVELWGLIGLLHDIDYDYVERDMKRHGLEAYNILKGLLPEPALQAIAGHNEHNEFVVRDEYAKKVLSALRAADHASGLIVATALVMPSKKLEEVKLESLLRKFKSKDFARGVSRERIREIEKLGVKLEEFLDVALNSMRSVASELGL